MRIVLFDLFGPSCVSLEDGFSLFEKIYPKFKENQSIELDFSNIKLLFSPFLMGCIGKLLNFYEKETIMSQLVLCNISQEHLKTVNEFIDRADRQTNEENDRETMESLFEEDELGEI